MSTKVFTVAEMVAAERAADAAGTSYEAMMETAGRRVAQAIGSRIPVTGKNILILVGPGNNGGDGLVAGRYLAEMGADVAFYLYKSRNPDLDKNFRLVQEMGLFIVESEHDQRYRVLRTRLNVAEILIDSFLGTGVTRPISGNLADLMKQVKRAVTLRRSGDENGASLVSIAELPPEDSDRRPKPLLVAVDCPSGLNCDTGELDPLALAADLTVTFAGSKRGHFRFPGAAASGELVVADINISETLPEVSAVNVSLVTPQLARTYLPERPLDGHKGTFGTALIAAGSEHYWGASALAGRGALRAGAGLVALAVPEVIRATVAGQLPEATYPPVSAELRLDADSAASLVAMGAAVDAFLVGPGLGPAEDFVNFLLSSAEPLPRLIIDADGLNILAGLRGWAAKLPASSILTPHPGEMARLMNRPFAEVKSLDRVELAERYARKWGHVLLLKGAYSVVASPDGRVALMPFANPLLAVGGSGDVLAGVIAALVAQGLEPFEAAVLGGYLHGAAGSLAVDEFGDSGLLASEIADLVPKVRKRLLNG